MTLLDPPAILRKAAELLEAAQLAARTKQPATARQLLRDAYSLCAGVTHGLESILSHDDVETIGRYLYNSKKGPRR